MKVAHVKKARKSPGQCGKCCCEIPAGGEYRWWKFRFSGKRIRCAKPDCKPKPSELINSPFLSALMGLQEETDAAASAGDLGRVREIADEVRQLGEEAQSSLDNMPDGLQQGSAGELLQSRAEKCEEIACELESLADNVESAWSEADGIDWSAE